MESLQDIIRKKLKEKVVIPEVIQPIKKEALRPPKTPKPIIDYEGIDFNKIANSSEFRRFIYMIRTGSTFRGSNIELDKKLLKTEKEITLVKELGRGSPQDFRKVVSELKEALAKRKAKLQDQEE